jgi:anti-sigma-K factor RskA
VSSDRSDLHALTGLYAIDALDHDEREQFERHLETCEPCQEEVAGFRSTAARLGDAIAESPPPSLRESVLAAATTTPQVGGQRSSGRPRNLSRITLAVAAALVLVVAGWLALRPSDPDAELIDQVAAAGDSRTAPIDGEGWTGRLVWSDSAEKAVLVVDEMPRPPSGKVYETWVIDAAGARRSALFTPDDEGRAVVAVSGFRPDAEKIAVTPEPPEGVDAATGEVVASVVV